VQRYRYALVSTQARNKLLLVFLEGAFQEVRI
jgi:hypothetical protein